MKPRLLDLFCGAGGAAMGYHRAGFEVVGVDIKPQPNYPFRLIQRDAIEFMERWDPSLHPASVIHASPPCQNDTAYNRRPNHVKPVQRLIERTRELLEDSGRPWVIENVQGAPLRNPVQLCGSSFGLAVRRHRLFETNFPIMVPPCYHGWQTPKFPAATNREENSRRTVEVGVWRIPLAMQQEATGIDWMGRDELAQAIPPAYTEHIGGYLMAEVERKAAAHA